MHCVSALCNCAEHIASSTAVLLLIYYHILYIINVPFNVDSNMVQAVWSRHTFDYSSGGHCASSVWTRCWYDFTGTLFHTEQIGPLHWIVTALLNASGCFRPIHSRAFRLCLVSLLWRRHKLLRPRCDVFLLRPLSHPSHSAVPLVEEVHHAVTAGGFFLLRWSQWK